MYSLDKDEMGEKSSGCLQQMAPTDITTFHSLHRAKNLGGGQSMQSKRADYPAADSQVGIYMEYVNGQNTTVHNMENPLPALDVQTRSSICAAVKKCPEGYGVSVEYCTHLYLKEAAERLLGMLRQALCGMLRCGALAKMGGSLLS